MPISGLVLITQHSPNLPEEISQTAPCLPLWFPWLKIQRTTDPVVSATEASQAGMYVCTHTHTEPLMYVCACAHTHTCTPTHTHIHPNMDPHICTQTYTHTCTQTHTHTHTFSSTQMFKPDDYRALVLNRNLTIFSETAHLSSMPSPQCKS